MSVPHQQLCICFYILMILFTFIEHWKLKHKNNNDVTSFDTATNSICNVDEDNIKIMIY